MAIRTTAVASSSSRGIGFAGLLTVAFIVLKLCGVIAWPWLWVLSPLWIGAAVVFGILLLIAVIFGLVMGILGIIKFFASRR